MTVTTARRRFYVEIIKPSHYDDDGYVIQWWRAYIPSNSLACMWSLVSEAREQKALGDDVDIVINAYDETHTAIPTRTIIQRIQQAGGKGIVFLAGVQSNQFPRAADLAREFRAAGIPVAVGGFHVSGCVSMLDELPADLRAAQEMGVTLFAGEAEGRLGALLRDADRGRLKPLYNYLDDLPELPGQATPFLPAAVAERNFNFTAFDAGRGCPFRCSFCTIINVQGRKSRHRTADDVEHVVRTYARQGINRFFITDDNMSRNRNWESIFDRLGDLRHREGLKLNLIIQVDTMCHKIPGFIEKASRAGVRRVFIGMENVNPDNLVAAKKFQNKISEYRKMLLAWRDHQVLTIAGYILGFPNDTPASIERDIRLIQRELPIDILEFFMLTPLPGSADHKELLGRGTWMNPDMNIYDLEHATTNHPRMTAEEWQRIYHRAWHLYYSPEHVRTLIRRALVSRTASRLVGSVASYYGSIRFEHVHPLQAGLFRRKARVTRRPGFPRESPLVFYPRRLWQLTSTALRFAAYYVWLEWTRRRFARDPNAQQYRDQALTPVADEPAEPAQRALAPARSASLPLVVVEGPKQSGCQDEAA